MYRYFALYLIFINIIAFCAYGIDKKRAVRNQWRISEKALLGLFDLFRQILFLSLRNG